VTYNPYLAEDAIDEEAREMSARIRLPADWVVRARSLMKALLRSDRRLAERFSELVAEFAEAFGQRGLLLSTLAEAFVKDGVPTVHEVDGGPLAGCDRVLVWPDGTRTLARAGGKPLAWDNDRATPDADFAPRGSVHNPEETHDG